MFDFLRLTPARRPGLLLLAGALIVFCPACGGSGQRSIYPVTGQVVVGKDKQPATGVTVVFHPVTDDGGAIYRPMGEVDANGKFSLTTYTKDDGAPAGEYIITLSWIPPRKLGAPEPQDRLKGAYNNPKTSKLPHFTVQSGATNEVPLIQLP
jgi:hypothetical protein